MPDLEITRLRAVDIPRVVSRVTHNLTPVGFPNRATVNLEAFLKRLHQQPSVTALALISRPEAHALHMHGTLNTQDYRENSGASTDFSTCFPFPMSHSVRQPFTFEFNIVTIGSPSAKNLFDYCVRSYGAGWSAGTIAVLHFARGNRR